MEAFTIGPSMGETMGQTKQGLDYRKVNLLTKRLLAEGYSAENYPDYVRIPSGCWDPSGNKLYNIYGGFEYTRKAIEERVYETPCGILCLGSAATGSTCWMGTEWSHENDCPIVNCPCDCTSCTVRPEPFASNSNGIFFRNCPVHPTERTYAYEGSLEQLRKMREERIEAARKEFLATHKNACPQQIRYDDRTDKWFLRYNPDNCIDHGRKCRFCTCLQKDLGTAVGNIYYDIELEGRDTTKDGTLFEGERFHSVHKGFQIYDKPVNLVWAEAALKVNRRHMFFLIRYNRLGKLVDAVTLYRAEQGEIDLRWEFKNFRIVRKDVRDLEQDLADIAEGIKITHVLDETKLAKQAKQMRRAKAADARARKQRKLVLTKDLDAFEMKKAIKALGKQEVDTLLKQRARPKKEPSSVQLTLFDLGLAATADG